MSKQFVYALSSLGQVSLSQYNELFKTLYIPEYRSVSNETEINHRGQVSRILDSLGYIEFNFDLRKVFVCPPALVLLPSQGLPRVLLTGARTPSLLEKIKKSIRKRRNLVKMYRCSQNTKWLSLPDTISIEAAGVEPLKEIAEESNVLLSSECPAGWQIANISASIGDIESGLAFVSRNDINWKTRIFDAERLMFRYSKKTKTDEYMLAEYTHPLTQQKMHWIWNGTSASEVDRDWGRYIVLEKLKTDVIIYDETQQYLAVPLTVPLPRILARATALCSGRAPVIHGITIKRLKLSSDSLFYVYTEVPQEVARIIAQKTGQNIIFSKINIK